MRILQVLQRGKTLHKNCRFWRLDISMFTIVSFTIVWDTRFKHTESAGDAQCGAGEWKHLVLQRYVWETWKKWKQAVTEVLKTCMSWTEKKTTSVNAAVMAKLQAFLCFPLSLHNLVLGNRIGVVVWIKPIEGVVRSTTDGFIAHSRHNNYDDTHAHLF